LVSIPPLLFSTLGLEGSLGSFPISAHSMDHSMLSIQNHQTVSLIRTFNKDLLSSLQLERYRLTRLICLVEDLQKRTVAQLIRLLRVILVHAHTRADGSRLVHTQREYRATRQRIRVVRLSHSIRQRGITHRLGRRHCDLLVYRRISAAVAMTGSALLRLLLTTTMFTTISRGRGHTDDHTRMRREVRINGGEPFLVLSRRGQID
ncbi:hypothetical protein PMAYCL1PPCAC_28597, partial [Pristionchus mayeri]